MGGGKKKHSAGGAKRVPNMVAWTGWDMGLLCRSSDQSALVELSTPSPHSTSYVLNGGHGRTVNDVDEERATLDGVPCELTISSRRSYY